MTNERFTKAVVWGDIDHDRYPDLFVSNLHGDNRLYHNQGDGTFRDVAIDAGVADFQQSFPAFFWDYNNDGRLDLFVASYETATHKLARSLLGQSVDGARCRLYQGDGHGNFRNVASESRLDEPVFAMGLNFGDLNNDGYLDFYLGTGDVDFRHIVPNKMYLNESGNRFKDVSYPGGFGHLQKGHAIAFADFDLDGDLDIFQQMGGAYLGDQYPDAFYENPGFGNSWLGIDVRGTDSNRSAIGTRITAQFTSKGTRRTVYRWVNSGGSFGANPLRQTVGLESAERVDRLEVLWPKTGKTQVFEAVPVNRIIHVTEGQSKFTVPTQLEESR